MRAGTWMIEAEHRINAPPDVVFEYFTDPEKYRRWKGANAELDPRRGGIYRVTMAPDVWVRGEYVEVDPPNRLVLTWGFEGSIELPRGLAHVPPGSSTVEFRFVADGDGTIIHLRHMGLPTPEADWAHRQGWEAYLSRLVGLFDGTEPGRDPIVKLAAKLYRRDAESQKTLRR